MVRVEVPVEIRVAAPAPLLPKGSVVYYICWRGRDEVKIGVTQNIEKRAQVLSTQRSRAIVMATEPGGYALERRRHRQFASLRLAGTELFRYAPVLAEHIDALRRCA